MNNKKGDYIMKTTTAILLSILLSISACVDIRAEEFSVSQCIKNCMLINNPTAHEKVIEANEASIQEAIALEYAKPINDNKIPRAEYIKLIKSNRVLNAERSFAFYTLNTKKYSKQYAESGRFNYLIMPEKNGALFIIAEC